MKHQLTYAAALLMTSAPAWAADPQLPVFDPANFDAGQVIDNPFLPLAVGSSFTVEGDSTEDGETVHEKSVTTVQGPGPVIEGVATTAVLDEAWVGPLLVEKTFDYYAQDRSGNVWYFGEDVTNFNFDDEDKPTGTDNHGTWRTGVNGAKPGYAMPASPEKGFAYFQEYAVADEATDFGVIETVDGAFEAGGRSYTGVLRVFESSTSEPDAREFKYYAPGIGLIREDEELSEDLSTAGMVSGRVAP